MVKEISKTKKTNTTSKKDEKLKGKNKKVTSKKTITKKEDKKVKKEQTDENLNRITYSIDSIGNIYYSLVSKEKYYEFAYPHLEPYYNAMIEYKTGVLSEIKDTELYSLASAQYSKKYSNCLKKIVEKIESLPSINNSGLSEEEVEFYRTLILSKQPFTPYSGK